MAPVYLYDFATYKPPEELRMVASEVEEYGKQWPQYRPDIRDFMWKVFIKSGLSPTSTFLPANVHPKHVKAPVTTLTAAQEEASMVMGGAVSDLLERTGIRPDQIDILVTCCSIFCPTPSMASMLVNKFGMRKDIQSYHLGGMGCGTGVIAVGLIRDLLQAHPNAIAMFVPSEITSFCTYPGDVPNFMVANVIFRMGGAAVLFTNKPSMRAKSKYQLMHAERTHHGQSDDAYQCMAWTPDPKGVNGVYLGKNVIKCAGSVVTETLVKTIARVMTVQQYAEYGANWVTRNWLGYKDVPKYQPDLSKCIDHFVIHAGGYAVLKGIQDKTKLSAAKMIPSFAVLREYGNTSCSTTWYALGYLETCEGVKKGQTVLQMGVGGGMKAGANIWRVLRDIRTRDHRPWVHLADTPLTEADLPRGIDLGDIRDMQSQALNVEFVRETERKKAAAAAAKAAAAEAEAREEEVGSKEEVEVKEEVAGEGRTGVKAEGEERARAWAASSPLAPGVPRKTGNPNPNPNPNPATADSAPSVNGSTDVVSFKGAATSADDPSAKGVVAGAAAAANGGAANGGAANGGAANGGAANGGAANGGAANGGAANGGAFGNGALKVQAGEVHQHGKGVAVVEEEEEETEDEIAERAF